MTIWKRWIQRSVLCGLLLGGLVGLATIAGAEGLPPTSDHSAMAAYYDKEAASLRQTAKDMERQLELYKKDPSLSKAAVVSKKINFVQHCEVLAASYTKAAEEAEILAEGHRGMVK